MSHRRKVTLWMWAFAAAFWLVIPPLVLPYVIPGTWFYDPGTLFVEDAEQGTSPGIASSREIRRSFLGRWQSQVWLVSGGHFERVAGCRKESHEFFRYRVDATIPDDADLNWWLEIPPNAPCEMGPGKYRVTTDWFIRLPWMPWVIIETNVSSNVFTITEPRAGLGLRRRL